MFFLFSTKHINLYTSVSQLFSAGPQSPKDILTGLIHLSYEGFNQSIDLADLYINPNLPL